MKYQRESRNFLAGKVCLVTGGAQGIGWAIAQALADYGGLVFACDLSQEYIAEVTTMLSRLPWGNRIRLAHCDVTDRDALESWITAVYAQTGRIDILVNNAAFLQWGSVLGCSVKAITRMMEVSFYGMVYGVKAVLPIMMAGQGGTIVNMGSSVSQAAILREIAGYTAAKSAIDSFTQTLQMELQDTSVNVILIRPTTVIGTDFIRKYIPSSSIPRMTDFIPVVTPPQVAHAVIQAIRQQNTIVDVPNSNRLLYWLFRFLPGITRWLVRQGGIARRDYRQITWQYREDK